MHMLLEMFANELSLVPQAADILIGQKRATQFIQTMRAATQMGVQRTLRMGYDFLSTPFAPDYCWHNWRNDKRVDPEAQRFFNMLATKMPYLEDDPLLETKWKEIDCYWQTQQAAGLKAAYVGDGLGLSMLLRAEWDNYLITCEIQALIDGDVSSQNEQIHHASDPKHIALQSDWIKHRIQMTVKNGAELWDRVGAYFPLLDFCPAVQNQLRCLPPDSLHSILRGLFYLNFYCGEWKSGKFVPKKIKCSVSRESGLTLNTYAI
jgi:hypothetical protein